MEDTNIIDKIKKVLGIETKDVEVKLEQITLENGTIVEADKFEKDAEVFIVTNDERVALPVGDYKLTDGRILSVKQDGVIAEIGEAAEEAMQEKPKEEVEAKEDNVAKKIIESISKETHFDKDYLETELQKLRDEFNDKLEALKPKDTKLEKEEEKTEPLKHAPDNVEQKSVIAYSQDRTLSTEDYVFKLLFNKN